MTGAAMTGIAVAGLTMPSAAPAAPVAGRARHGDASGAVASSTFFSTAFVEYAASLNTASDGDLWATAWADDDNVYAANGDGRGFSDEPFQDIVVNRITGRPETGIQGARLAAADEVGTIWADPNQYNRKPTGMVCVDGTLYLAVQDLNKGPGAGAFNDVPNASISRSDDHGVTWQKTTSPMFTDHVFTTIFFADFGKNYANAEAALGAEGARYVYAYGLDGSWRDSYDDSVPDPTSVYLARVPRDAVQDRAKWEFYIAADTHGAPRWSSDIARKKPVLTDTRRQYPTIRTSDVHDLSVISQGGVLYLKALDRYVYTSWTEYTFEFYEAPEPWGPWQLFLTKDLGGYPWFGMGGTCPGPKNGGYATTIPSKFVADDGRSMWLQCNWWVGNACGDANYHFSLRKMHLEPFVRAEPDNAPDPGNNLARTGANVTTIEKSAHFGHGAYYNDGDRTNSEDSFDQEDKTLDWWGYTWSQPYWTDRVVYTTGQMFPDGGWFSGDLRVQVRQNFTWHDVHATAVNPAYPYDSSAGPNKTFTFTFPRTWGDGVRVIGSPGGSAHFTSIGELEVYYG